MNDFKLSSIRHYITILEAEEANPYASNPAQAAIYAAMSPEDKAWATKGGGRPDLTDPYIAARAPNKFKPVAVATPVAAPAPAAPAAPAAQEPAAAPAAPAAQEPVAAPAAPAAAPQQAAQPAAAPKQWNKGVLGRGSKGPEVNALQKKLGIPETGVYDAATITAVQGLQKKLGVAADGAYGPQTKAAHDKSGQGAQPSANVAPAGQPPSTAARPELGTVKGATQAIPTAPVDPTNPSGVGAKAELTPDQAAVRKDILAQPTDAAGNTTDATGTVYKRDLEWMKNFGQNGAPASAPAPAAPQRAAQPAVPPGQTAGGAVTSRPIQPATGARAQMLQRQQAQNQTPEGMSKSDAQLLEKMLSIAGLR